ncbi:hypothetical protein ACIA5G_18835 [Amycolatopsis sp. NPDC051758]|uniref:hypothetical protein n=1 Tax=Amycolatopsis sp. NPDC051758 TaxID=3363935 RepID=UPI00379FFE79
MTNRAGRRVPPAVAGVSLGLGFVVLPAGGAPAELVTLAASMPASLVVAITLGAKFKISLHAAAASAAVVVVVVLLLLLLTLTYGPWALLPALLVAWVTWSAVAVTGCCSPR